MKNTDINSVYRKSEALADELRSRIVSGRYAPGDRLPSRDAMMDEYGVSRMTVQSALQKLGQEGFVVSVPRHGTFVAKHMPHQVHYALLFGQLEEAANSNHFNRALAKAARSFHRGYQLDLHYGFEGARGFQRYQTLAEDVQKRRIAGLLFASPPFVLKNTPLLDVPAIPRSAFMSPRPDLDIPAVSVDSEGFIGKLVAFVIEHGCQRIAVLLSSIQAEKFIPRIQAGFKAAGISIHPNWFLGSDTRSPLSTRTLTRLLMSGCPDVRPDCLIVTDDNLLPPVSESLREMAIFPPSDLQLLAHCNFPWPTASAVPAVRLGYSMTDCIEAMMRQIADQQNQRIPQPVIRIPAYFEWERELTIDKCRGSSYCKAILTS